ncbi:MAG: tRNA pseudouridine synthase [Bacteroidota bacterium]|nr:tRNA pseudouridine synthase [Bacteroidota bacterium]
MTSSNFNFSEGEVILIDKPLDWTSFDVVNKIKFALKKNFGAIKIGHAGTLDPKATGLLILCTGKKTKNIQEIQDAEKEYTGSIYLGATTPCFDTEKEIDETFDISGITNEDILKCRDSFLGEQEQFPPIHSAVKIDGKRAYQLARQGKEVNIKSKIITIYEFDITKIDLPLIDFNVRCSKGTYIRSLANDFGKRLNSGAYLHALRRTKIGTSNVDDALKIEDFLKSLPAAEN